MMDNSFLSGVSAGLWIVPLAILLTLLALYAFSRYWRTAAARDLKYLGSSMRGRAQILDNLLTGLDELEAAGEPFSALIAKLEKRVDEARSLLVILRQRYGSCQNRFRKLDARGWRALIGAPFLWGEWVELRRRINDMQSDMGRLHEMISGAENGLMEIDTLGWVTALQVRDMQEQLERVAVLIEQATGQNLHGHELEDAVRSYGRITNSLRGIPEFFLAGDKQEVLSRVHADEIVSVYAILKDNQAEVEALQSRLQAWDRQYRQAALKVEKMRACVADAEALLPEMPSILDSSEYELRLKSIRAISHVLTDTLARLEIGAIDEVAARADDLHRSAKETVNTLRQARRELIQLKPALEELKTGSAEITRRYMHLGKSDLRPVLWDQSRDRLVAFNRRVQEMSAIEEARTPEQVHSDLRKARDLLKVYQELEGNVGVIADQHAQFVALLTREEIRLAGPRFSSMRELGETISKYHPDNWQGLASRDAFSEDVSRQQRIFHKKVAPGLQKPVRESELADELQETGVFIDDCQNLERQADRLRERLARLNGMKKSARKQLNNAGGALQSLSFLVASNPFLQQIGEKQIAEWRDQLLSLGVKLDHPDQGSLEKIARNVRRSIEQIEIASAGWLRRLDQDIDAKKAELDGKLDRISEIAELNDPVIERARVLISRRTSGADSRGLDEERISGLNVLIGRLKGSSEYWQSCSAVLRELEERVEGPLLEAYREALSKPPTRSPLNLPGLPIRRPSNLTLNNCATWRLAGAPLGTNP
jgi:hypothetical protein